MLKQKVTQTEKALKYLLGNAYAAFRDAYQDDEQQRRDELQQFRRR
jgi:hypothetical protein